LETLGLLFIALSIFHVSLRLLAPFDMTGLPLNVSTLTDSVVYPPIFLSYGSYLLRGMEQSLQASVSIWLITACGSFVALKLASRMSSRRLAHL
jgi:hypothetical protein